MKNFKLLKNPKETYDLLYEITSIDIYNKSRARQVIEHRAFFCYVLRDKLKMTFQAIAKFLGENSEIKTYHHATAINSYKQFIIYRKYEVEYWRILESHFNVSSQFEYSQLSKLLEVQDNYDKLEKNYIEALNTIKEYKIERFDGYTKNELNYRKLGKDQKQQYDERAQLVLKSFEWKKPKDDYEVITCAS